MWFPRRQKGAVLVLVLWVLALLAMVGGYYAVEARIRTNLERQYWSSLEAREAAASILLLVAGHLAQPGTDPSQAQEEGFFMADGTVYKVRLGSLPVTFSVRDEQGKLDLNNSSQEQILTLLSLFLPPEEARSVTDAIMDWRDSDGEPREDGAEEEYYLDLIPPYHPTNGPFRRVDELQLVKGMNQELFFGPLSMTKDGEEEVWEGGLWELFTVYNQSGDVVEEYASSPLLTAFGQDLTQSARSHAALCLKLELGGRLYRIYWAPQAQSPGYRVLEWTEIQKPRGINP